MMPIKMLYTKTLTKKNNEPKKTKSVHPQILKIMSRPNNIPKPVSSEDIAIANTFSSFNARYNLKSKIADTQNVQSPNVANSQNAIINQKDFSFINASSNKKKSFYMNFSQLSTGKPCGSCGGR